MKRWIHASTEVKTYRNTVNPNKHVEVHENGYGHRFDSSTEVKRSTKVKASKVIRSGASIDFAWKDDYDSNAIEEAIINAFEDGGAEVTGMDFYSVDYSQYPEYADKRTSQVGVDFTWYDNADYNADSITSSIEEDLTSLGYQFLGIDFYSQMD